MINTIFFCRCGHPDAEHDEPQYDEPVVDLTPHGWTTVQAERWACSLCSCGDMEVDS
jgi:hypothetical protein